MYSMEIIGDKYNRWTVIAKAENRILHNKNRAYWVCKCECGIIMEVEQSAIRGGMSKSCGCLKRDRTRQRNFKHGMAHTSKSYSIWAGMIQRCLNPKCSQYKDYGGRGISVCERWTDFENFHKDMGEKPTDKSLDRIDNNGNYDPENCRWANRFEQSQNARSNIILHLNGVKKCAAEWGRILGIPENTIYARHRKGLLDCECLQVGRRPRTRRSI